MRNRNAYIGRNVEILFKNSVGDNPAAIAAIQNHFNIEGRFLGAISTGIHAEKTDVKMEFADGHNVDANVKAFKESSVSYNQLTRTSLANFCRRFSLTGEQPELERLFIAKANDVKSKLFPESVHDRMRPVFQRIARDILLWSFSFRQSREIVVVYERDASVMLVYPMREVLREIGTAIAFTDRGNISIGSCVTFQRKGGDGIHAANIPKGSLRHPGNDVQIKLKMNEFVGQMRSVLLTSYTI
jgi:hypothetical protein